MQSRSGRAVFGVNAAISAALVVLVAAVALVVNPPSPPGIAAFAPQANKPITKAPPGQSSTNGAGSGRCATGQVCVGPSATPSPTASPKPGQSAAPVALASPTAGANIGVPSSLQCATWPDGSITQTFDPQSPPCIATWPEMAKGNGGATAPGVTKTDVRVAVPVEKSNSALRQMQTFADFLNTHYELYGRKIVLVPYPSAQLASTSYTDPSTQHADAEQTKSLGVFASLDFLDSAPVNAALPTWYQSLAKNHVIALMGGAFAPNTTQRDLQASAPYAWTYKAPVDTLLAQAGIQACKQLVGKKAIHAPDYRNAVRKFAIVLPDSSAFGGPVPGINALVSTLTGCGANKPTIIYSDNDTGTAGAVSASFTQLKAQGVTTIIQLLTAPAGNVPAETAANNVGYTPEWDVLANNTLEAANVATYPKAQAANSFGIMSMSKLNDFNVVPWRTAYLDAGGDYAALAKLLCAEGVYSELSLLAAGIQMAGPHLTPATFSGALTTTEFPNPGAAEAPTYQATVGFPQAGAAMSRDFVGWWIDPDANQASTIRTGLAQAGHDYQNFCWVSSGRRYVDGSWPTTDKIRQGVCR